MKKWPGLSRSSSTSIFYLPAKKGSLALPTLMGLCKKLQTTKTVQLFMSRDRGVKKAAALRLIEEEGRQRLKFRPAVLVNSIMLQDHSRSRRVMSATARSLLAYVEDTERHQ